MKAAVAVLLATVAGLLLAPLPARAEPLPGKSCDLPAYLVTSDSVLKNVAASVSEKKALPILVVGTMSSMLPGKDGVAAAYPVRLQAALAERLPGIDVKVDTELLPKKSAADVQPMLARFLEDHKPVLVIWQTGTSDAVRAVDPDEFHTALDDGVSAIQKAGADVILVNPQYSPRTEAMFSLSGYLDIIRAVAQQFEIPVFDRFSAMRHWNDEGDFDLSATTPGLDLAKRVHDCVGRALATLVIETAKINPAELRIQR